MGWFWTPERDFRNQEGILDAVVGYSGSATVLAAKKENNDKNEKVSTNNDDDDDTPTYQNIQDYAECIRLKYDPNKLDYSDLLEMFFAFHTPSPPNFTGTQYRSAILYHTPEQKAMALKKLEEDVSPTLAKFVSVEESTDFYRAEEYHQRYLDKAMSSFYI